MRHREPMRAARARCADLPLLKSGPRYLPPMGISDLDDTSVYAASVRLRSADAPDGWVVLPDRVVRFGPPGWLSVAADRTADAAVDLYPLYMVLSVDNVRDIPRKTAAFSL